MGKGRSWTPSSQSGRPYFQDKSLLPKVQEVLAEFPHYGPEQVADQLAVYPQFRKASRVPLIREVKRGTLGSTG